MIKLICIKCGYKIEVFENELYSYSQCELCSNRMVLDVKEKEKIETDRTDILLDNLAINQMAHEIDMIGHAGVWEMIEAIPLYFHRLKYRKYFIVVGGKVPEIDLFSFDTRGGMYLKEI